MSLLSLRNLRKQFGETLVLKDVNADIEAGEVISIIGPSGTGKSTLLRAINMLDPPTSGEVILDGEVLSVKGNINAARRKMGMVFQNFGLFSHLNIMENVSLGQIKLLGRTKEAATARSLEVLKSVGLGERAYFMPTELSGGQKQRAAIARVLAMEPEIILFDEPTSALDPTMVGEVSSVIRNLASTGITMLVVTHEMRLAQDISTRVFYMDEQGIYEEGSAALIFSNPERPKTRDFINRVRSFVYELDSPEADFVEMLNGVEVFCRGAGLDGKLVARSRLVAEELVLGLTMPQVGQCTLEVSYSDVIDELSVAVSYPGRAFDVLTGVGGASGGGSGLGGDAAGVDDDEGAGGDVLDSDAAGADGFGGDVAGVDADNLSALIVQNSSTSVTYSYEDNLNRIIAELAV